MPKPVLVVMHVASEGPGTLGAFLERNGFALRAARLYAGDALPDDPRAFAAILSMGGPMNVYEEDEYPYLRAEDALLRRAIAADVPVLGVCLGAQLIAKACDAAVYKAPAPEIGWSDVALTDDGRLDPLFAAAPPVLRVLQWHGDTFDIPSGGVHLAANAGCPNQAFRYRDAVGLQFHVEVDDELLRAWFGLSEQGPAILREYRERQADLTRQAESIYSQWVKAIR